MVNFKNLRDYGFNTNSRTFIIAEIGINHNGSLRQAEKMISAAARAGVDAVKFQTYITEKRTHKDSPIFDILKSCELTNEDFIQLKIHATSCGVEFFSTPFDEESVDFLESISCNLYKVASFDITNLKLISRIAQTDKPVIMSTGMSSIEEIKAAVNTVIESDNTNIALLHCVSAYPTAEKDANLSKIFSLEDTFKNICVIGQSDHTNDIIVPLYAVAAGAQIIEKHFMLDGSTCPDSPVSIDQFQMTKLVEETRRLEAIFGHGEFGVVNAELGTLQYRRKSYV